MRVLILHNYYQHPGGEDFVFLQEVNSLKKHIEVETLTFKNQKSLEGAVQNLFLPFNIFAWKKIKRKIENFRPDVVHFHNIHYAIGPWFIRELYKKNIKTVMTIHNYRLICPSAILFHNGDIYEKSLNNKFPWTSIQDKIVDNSYLKTFWYSLNNFIHRKIGTWNQVDRYLALTEFAKETFIKANFPINHQKIIVKPNYISHSDHTFDLGHKRNENFLFIGRLTEEKGIKVLINTFKNTDYRLRIAGDGPLKDWVKEAQLHYSNIEYLGSLNKNEIQAELKSCKALIFPSTWYEGMPMTILESFQTGTPVIASRLGAMQSMIHNGINGYLFEKGNEEDLKNKIQDLLNLKEIDYISLQNNTYQSFLNTYTEDKNIKLLLSIYKSLI